MTKKITDDEFREKLTPAEYDILRLKGTERAFTGEFVDTKTPGHYHCKGCGAQLFSSESKYDSGSGWPSFTEAAADGIINEIPDHSGGRIRTEITCGACDSHLGHVFDDGPGPTKQRFCVNSASLTLNAKD